MLRTFAVTYENFARFVRVARRNGWQVESVQRDFGNGMVYVVAYA